MRHSRLVAATTTVALSLLGLGAPAAASDPATIAPTGGHRSASAAVGTSTAAEPLVTYGGGDLEPLVPSRVLDTRTGVGAPGGLVGAGGVVSLDVTGVGGVPDAGVGAVALNVTAVAASATTYVTVWPHGAVRPVASSLNLVRGDTAPNLVVTKVGRDGKVDLFNNSGAVHLLADVVGWFPEASSLQPLVPARILDTRTGVGGAKARVGASTTVTVQATGAGGIPTSGVAAVVVNLTGVSPTATTYVTAFPSGQVAPLASNLNLVKGQVRPNLAIVKLGTSGRFSLFNKAGEVDLLADVVGWFPTSSAYGPLTPARVLDTRTGLGAPKAALGAGKTLALTVAGHGGVPSTGVGAVVLNLTGIAPTASTFVTAWPTGQPRPTASVLNLRSGQVAANLVVVKVGAGGAVSVYNNAGSTHLAADVVGWFPTGTTSTTAFALTPGTTMHGPGDLVSVTGDATDGGTVVFAASSDAPAVGGHFVFAGGPASGAGVSGLVTARTANPNGTVSATFSPANLQDLFTDLEIHSSQATPASDASSASSPAGRSMRLTAVPECTVEGGVVAAPSVSFDGMSGQADFSLRELSARLDLRGEVTFTWTVAVTGGFTCSLTLLDGPLGWVGPVEFGWSVDLSASVSNELSTSTSVSIPVRIGFQYDDGDVTDLNSADLSGEATDDEEFSAQVSASLTESLSAKMFGVVGVEIGIGPQLDLAYEPNNGLSCVTLEASLRISVAGVAEKWGLGWSFATAEFVIASKELFRSDGCGGVRWDGSITVDAQWAETRIEGGETAKATQDATYVLGPLVEKVGEEGRGRYATTVSGSAHEDRAYTSGACPSRGDFDATFAGATRQEGIVMFGDPTNGWYAYVDGLDPTPDEEESGTAGGGVTSTWCDGSSYESWATYPGGYWFLAWPQAGVGWPSDDILVDTFTDTDPDPAHLVGTSSFSQVASDGTFDRSRSITFTYDLRLVPITGS
ncbi:hypothetical protein [Oryzobacter telluris]|uniref:hypothetical protein n=1 Tax=Oryzobacter telluris TaxID=3149179 RepID=UPI00370D2CBD